MKKRLNELLNYEQPTKYIVKTENYSDEYVTPVLTAGKSFILGHTNETEGIFKGSKEPVIIFDDFTRDTKYVDFDFKVKSSAMKILHKYSKDDSLKYFHYAINSIKYTPFSHKRLWISDFSKLEIEYPTPEMQHKIANNLDTIQSAIDNKKQQLSLLDEAVKSEFVEMFGDPILNEKGWDLKTLPELGEFGRGVSKHRPRNAPELLGGKYPLIQTGDIANANLYITNFNSTYSEEGYKQSKIWKAGTLCITIAATIAKTAILTFDSCFPDSVVGFTPNKKTNSLFINYWFSFFQKILEEQAPGVAQKNINLKFLSELKIFTPPFELQERFATFVQQIDTLKSLIKEQLVDLQELLDSKMNEYFGE